MARIDFGGVIEEVVTAEEFTLERAREVLEKETVAVLGYGVQGPGQALNMRDNGINVIVGQREGSRSWQRALDDGFVAGKTLFPLEEAADRGTIVQFLVSDAGQVATWPAIKTRLHAGDALYFSHGFSIAFKDQTGVVPPDNVDVILVAPKGSGRVLPCIRTTRGEPASGLWLWALPSVPVIFFRRPFRRRSTAISSESVGS
jgi:ketol-acid reductoisomerase